MDVYSSSGGAAALGVSMEGSYREQNQRLSSDNRHLQEEVRRLQQMLDDKDRKIPAYETALDKLQRKYTEALAQLDQEREKSYSGLALMNSRESRYTRQQKLIEELQAELRQLRAGESSTSSALAEERRQAEQARGQLHEALRVSRSTQHDVQRLNVDLKAAQKALREERERVAMLRQQLDATRDREGTSAARVADAVAQLEVERDRHAREMQDLRTQNLRDVDAARAEERRLASRDFAADAVVRERLRRAEDALADANRSFSLEKAEHDKLRTALGLSPGETVTLNPDGSFTTAHGTTFRPSLGPFGGSHRMGSSGRDGLDSGAHIDDRCCGDKDAPSMRRLRRGRGALPVDRSQAGDLIATCRRRHCLRRFNVNDNASNMCGYHPVLPTTSYDGDFYPCCGVLIRPGAPNVFCQFRPHLA